MNIKPEENSALEKWRNWLYWTEMKPSCGDAGGTSRHEARLKTKVDLRRRTKVSDKRRWYLRRPTKVKQKNRALRAGHEAH